MNQIKIIYPILFFVILTSGIIRYSGITFGFPLSIHPDEPLLVGMALHILESGDLNPHFFNYPSLYLYFQSIVYFIVYKIGMISMDWGAVNSVDITVWLFWGRFITVLISTATILVTYMIGAVSFNRFVGLCSCIFIAYSFLHITNSYMITVDNPMAFWSLLSIFFAAYLFNNSSVRYYILSAACMGLAVSTKYTAYLCALPIFFAHLKANKFKKINIINKKLILAGLVSIGTFFLTTPYSLIEIEKFKEDIRFEANHYKEGHTGHGSKNTSYGFYFSALTEKFGIIQLLLAGFGMLLMLRNDLSRCIFFIIFPMVFFLFIGSYRTRFDRNLVVLIPFLAIFAGYAVFEIINSFQNVKVTIPKNFRKVVVILFGIVVIGAVSIQVKKSIDHILIITLPDTRYVAGVWIEKNIPKGVKIAREFYTPPINKKKYRDYRLGVCGVIKYDLNSFDYFIASSQDYGRIIDNREQYPEQAARYDVLFKKNELIKAFKPDNKTISGPEIRIYKKTGRKIP